MTVNSSCLYRTDALGAADGTDTEASRQDDERDPEQIGAEQVDHLHPGRGEEENVGQSERVLQEK